MFKPLFTAPSQTSGSGANTKPSGPKAGDVVVGVATGAMAHSEGDVHPQPDPIHSLPRQASQPTLPPHLRGSGVVGGMGLGVTPSQPMARGEPAAIEAPVSTASQHTAFNGDDARKANNDGDGDGQYDDGESSTGSLDQDGLPTQRFLGEPVQSVGFPMAAYDPFLVLYEGPLLRVRWSPRDQVFLYDNVVGTVRRGHFL